MTTLADRFETKDPHRCAAHDDARSAALVKREDGLERRAGRDKSSGARCARASYPVQGPARRRPAAFRPGLARRLLLGKRQAARGGLLKRSSVSRLLVRHASAFRPCFSLLPSPVCLRWSRRYDLRSFTRPSGCCRCARVWLGSACCSVSATQRSALSRLSDGTRGKLADDLPRLVMCSFAVALDHCR